VPTSDELTECQYITLTDDADWDPSTTDLTDYVPKEINQVNRVWTDKDNGESECILSSISSVYSKIAMRDRVMKSVRIVQQVASQTRHSRLSPEHLARTWNIGIDRAKDTLRVTTQKGI
jgi:hypothetical protein